MEELVQNKRVVIVGPAPSVIGSNQGQKIDGYDIVVRINKAVPVPQKLAKDIGTRTDILYNCLNQHPENGGQINIDLLKNNGVKILCCPYPYIPPFEKDIKKFRKQNNHKIPFRYVDKDFYLGIEKKMKTRPNSGVGSILDLLNFPVKELYITGFTFFKGGYYKEYRPYNEKQVIQRMAAANNHSQPLQIKYMKEVLKNDSRVVMDNELKKIISAS